MAKQYYIKKDPSAIGSDIEWTAINGKEFYQLITSPAGKGRYFIDMDEFMIEATEAEYKDWRKGPQRLSARAGIPSTVSALVRR